MLGRRAVHHDWTADSLARNPGTERHETDTLADGRPARAGVTQSRDMTTERPTPARPQEAGALIALLAAQLEEHAIPLAPELLAQAVEGALEDDGRALLLVSRDQGVPIAVAYLSFQWTLERGGRVLWLEELFVLPEHRGRGIGQRLLEAALEVARARSCRSVELEVEASHARAANLYRRAGFRPLDRVHWALALD